MKTRITRACLFIALLGFSGLQAQNTISTTGGDVKNLTGEVNYTIGQVFCIGNEGVQQAHGFFQTSVKDLDSDISLSLYPNPTDDFITLVVDDNIGVVNYSLYDTQGRMIKEGSTSSSSILDLSDMSKGSYFLKVKERTFKIIKN